MLHGILEGHFNIYKSFSVCSNGLNVDFWLHAEKLTSVAKLGNFQVIYLTKGVWVLVIFFVLFGRFPMIKSLALHQC